ncbi:helix-turn-helix domain-containing protein [Streptococcus uberis]|uniref:helix-turn-helix domain-containing protein n=1 Tax=Streptococcus uberis TaxID=1349 RepID=UPI0012B632AE|nr:helix-turn-helix transcriptional regulator [Streptococcus uberis]MTB56356.1 helix-turn-helix domain-containing protein [Streptococcus uberis]
MKNPRNRIKQLRNEHNPKLTQENLANEMGVTKLTISRWENEEVQIKPDKVKKLANFFGVSVGYLFGYSEDKKNPMQTSLELARRDETGEYIDLQDMVTLMDLAMLKSVDIRDKILINLKEYYDYNGERMKREYGFEDENDFDVFLAKFQEDTNDHIIMLLTGIINLRDDIRFTLLDLLTMEGEKLQTVKNVVKFLSDPPPED